MTSTKTVEHKVITV